MVDAPDRICAGDWRGDFGHCTSRPLHSGGYVEYVRADLYARLQEQVETLRKERDRYRAYPLGEHAKVLLDALDRAEAAEAERDRLRADIDRFMDELGPRWFLERNWFPSALQKEHQS